MWCRVVANNAATKMATSPPKGGDRHRSNSQEECPPTPPLIDAKAATPTREQDQDGAQGEEQKPQDGCSQSQSQSRPVKEESHSQNQSQRQSQAEGEEEEERASGSRPPSPDPHCPICLGDVTNVSYTDSCFHKFCFTCLLEWSRVRPVCPLCKAKFKAIIHTIKSDDNYESYELPYQLPAAAAALAAAREAQPGSLQLASLEAFMDREARFVYRTTMTRERLRQRNEEFGRRTG